MGGGTKSVCIESRVKAETSVHADEIRNTEDNHPICLCLLSNGADKIHTMTSILNIIPAK